MLLRSATTTKADTQSKKILSVFTIHSTSGNFSHNQVAPPPIGWVNAAHRHGVKILGTLILEHKKSIPDLLQYFRGDGHGINRSSIEKLVSLAKERNFDGYLLNIECEVPDAETNIPLLIEWISTLRKTLTDELGSHAQLIWYDSIVTTGELEWQNQLNEKNFPFFDAASSIFTNYTWPTHFPQESAEFLKDILENGDSSEPLKTYSDIFCGVDMWGRGSYGGGGFGAYKALQCIDPKVSRLSAAIFAQAWSWESQEDEPDWTWQAWWEHDNLLWLGAPARNHDFNATRSSQDQEKSQLVPGAYSDEVQSVPLASFFIASPPPPPDVLPFHTTFSPGVGNVFFVEGEKHFISSRGWTDLDKQTSLGSLVWPTIALLVESQDGDHSDLVLCRSHLAKPSLCFDDAWLGGSSLNITVTKDSIPIPDEDLPKTFMIPVEKVTLLPNRRYNYRTVSKSTAVYVVKPFARLSGQNSCVPLTTVDLIALSNGWEESRSVLVIEEVDASGLYVDVEIGIEVSAVGDAVPAQEMNVYLGQMSLSLESLTPPPRILSLDWIPTGLPASVVNGTLQWDVHQDLAPADEASSWAYFLVFTHNDVGITPQHPIFIGTTVGNATEFDVVQLPRESPNSTVGDASDEVTSHQARLSLRRSSSLEE
ncbi:glycosyl hydrolase family 85-domain-containing protein [Cantharellus anzutake]|uniref:glycosyl hydrolase family 85-domain-containing protein n=1 Tax=Cantharellus anzutake TaxID=1750568 RepID=UPI001902CAA1|nr:glycosyl hydrolase family 85-domain-containing protein [Cantharellus anzutake]KAF8341646.1 glycosyl hydrolase family 85-domain-containing protein [Cantharellus anzutake]